MGSNWNRRPILAGFDDAWIEDIIQDHLSMASWPRVPPEPKLEKDDGHSERKHIDHLAVQVNSDDYTGFLLTFKLPIPRLRVGMQ
jgi:hypothetical protein